MFTVYTFISVFFKVTILASVMMAAVDSLLVGRKKAIKHSLYYSKKMHYHFLTPFFYYCSEIAWIRIQIFGFNEYGTETLPEITLNMCICRFIISEILLTVKKIFILFSRSQLCRAVDPHSFFADPDLDPAVSECGSGIRR